MFKLRYSNKFWITIICKRSNSTKSEFVFNRNVICSAENKQKCIEKFQNLPEMKFITTPSNLTAAVLVPLCEHNGEMSLLFTLRSAKISKHNRQVSFPGGIRDKEDASYENCALRETQEEIGIDSKNINIWGCGKLIQAQRAPSIMPVIGEIIHFDETALTVNPDEVEQVFTVPLKQLCDPKHLKYTQFKTGYSLPTFVGLEHRIWGITSTITWLFLRSIIPKEHYKHPLKYLPKYKISKR